MKQKIWTKEERDLLRTDLTNEEISERTQRPLMGVKKARYKYTGHSVEKAKHRFKPTLDRSDSEARIIAKCFELGIKLEGVRG